ncbi:hypothetical protein ONZ43_g302 [Nemania bipapillata]|uniref:Uncharacterized protein n=1 Tax=Nemania bipapillata TaxID=110536 RepID=A0ACC2J8X2_9PEZI|nr:hypothetical protein ONZ43_g302 [Nemania bipapillata]
MAKTVVILGGAFAGVQVAHRLLKYTLPQVKDLKVVLVSKNSHFYWNLASVRAIVPGVLTEDQYTRPIAPGFSKYSAEAFEFIVGAAETVNTTTKTVTVVEDTGERELSYDYLVVATGTRNAGTVDVPWKNNGSYEEIKALLTETQEKVKAAKHIVVAGAGATGVEAAADLGFADGSFGTWRLHIEQRQLVRGYRHEASSNGEIIGVAFLYPYLLTATQSILISLYTFDFCPSSSNHPDHSAGSEADSKAEKGPESSALRGPDRDAFAERGLLKDQTAVTHGVLGAKEETPKTKLSAPYLLTSLKSHTSRAPLALSLRNTAGSTVASIAYTFSTIRGWSLGIQELHIRPIQSKLKLRPEIITTQLAYTLPVNRIRQPVPSPPLSPARQSRPVMTCAEEQSQNDQLGGPTSLSYTHPYLLATMPDNTLILHLCTSGPSSLSISAGIRLWGHTSGISDAEITARGKAVSVSCRGEEIRVWELEGRTNGRSIEVRPTPKTTTPTGHHITSERAMQEDVQGEWDERRNWVGFDDEMVIVLKESGEGRESLLVYDFT